MPGSARPTIDVQGHHLPDAQWEALSAHVAANPGFTRLARLLAGAESGSAVRSVDAARVATLDAAGVDVQVLSALPPGVGLGPPADAAGLARAVNDALAAAAARHPGRFVVLASLPLPHEEAALAEVERLAGEPLVRGVQVIADGSGWTIDEDRFEPLLRRVASLGLPVVLHPSLEPLPPVFDAYGLGSSVGAMLSTTLIGLRLVLSGMLDRVGDLDVVVPHLGGTIPYLAGRVSDLNGRGRAARDLRHYLRERLFYDSCSYQREALHCAVDTVGGDRIMLGSDFPFRGDLDGAVREVVDGGLPAATRDAILGGTARRWFDPAEPPGRRW